MRYLGDPLGRRESVGRKRTRDQCAAGGRRCRVLASQGWTARRLDGGREKECRGGRATVACGREVEDARLALDPKSDG
jgi:hypothetical protein